jgi:hypothetical protein
MMTQRGDVVWTTVGKTAFRVGPDGFVGVELGGVGRKVFEMKPGKLMAYLANPISFVNCRIVPNDKDVPAQMAQQVPEEGADLVMLDVLRVALEVQTDAPTPGSNGDSRDHGNTIMPVAMMNDGCLTTRSPGLPYRRDQEEARLVNEDDVGSQPCSVFFTLGQVFRFHRSMTSSFRSSARRSGFW